jgi:hypothetical protein
LNPVYAQDFEDWIAQSEKNWLTVDSYEISADEHDMKT